MQRRTPSSTSTDTLFPYTTLLRSHPKGMIIWNELMSYWQEQHNKEGYKQIKTPILMSHELWETSGHWDFYRENMYLSVVDEKTSVLKPMNRSEEHTSELQSLMRISYDVLCLTKKKKKK